MVKKRLTYVDPWQMGKVGAALYALLSLVFVAVFLVVFLFGKGIAHNIFFIVPLIIIMPIIYTLMGFFVGIVGAVIYNLVARWTGGIELTTMNAVSAANPSLTT